MKTRKDLIGFLQKYNMTSGSRTFTKNDVIGMNDHDLECWVAIMTLNFTDDLNHSLENADLHMKNGREKTLKTFFSKDPEKIMDI